MKDLGIRHPVHDFIASCADPTGKHWQAHTNKCVLPEKRDLPWVDKAMPATLVHPPAKAKAPKHGTLLTDDGNGGGKRRRDMHTKKARMGGARG